MCTNVSILGRAQVTDKTDKAELQSLQLPVAKYMKIKCWNKVFIVL